MWIYEKTLQLPVVLKCKDLRMAKLIMTQLGGPNGEMAAALRYLQQRYTMTKLSIVSVHSSSF